VTRKTPLKRTALKRKPAKPRAIRKNGKPPTRKTVSAIRKAEGQRPLRRPELIKMLDVEWSRCIRERDEYICQITGKYCEPGCQPGQGNAAHLIGKGQAPFHLKYDLRNGLWMEWQLHMEFDGLLAGKRRPARQSLVWGWLARNRPEDFAYLTGSPWKANIANVPIHELREKLEELRAWPTPKEEGEK